MSDTDQTDATQTAQAAQPAANQNDNSFSEAVRTLTSKLDELKEKKRFIKDIENDVPMELEEVLLALKDLRGQVKEQKEEHMRKLLETSADYVEYRESVQYLKEDIAQAKLDLFTAAANQSRKHGDVDRTIRVGGNEHRIQTQNEVMVYLNGKMVK